MSGKAMGTQRPIPAPIERAQLDRLVDNELPEPQRRALLLTLDQHPESWKRCALAFLEAQAWRGAVRAGDGLSPGAQEPAMRQAGPDPSLPPKVWHVIPRTEPQITKPQGVRSRWVLAASVLVAFGLGSWLGKNVVRGPGVSQVAMQPAGVGDQEPRPMTQVPVQDAAGSEPQVAQVAPPTNQPEVAPPGITQNSGAVRDFVPSEIEAILRTYGRRVERRHGYVSVGFDDGRRVSIPVHELELVPVSYPTY